MIKFKSILVAIIALIIFTSSSNAQVLTASYNVNSEDPMVVKYLGDDGAYLLFHVALASNKVNNALFAIEDKTEGELYSAAFATSIKTQTVKIEKKKDDQVLNFKLVVGKTTFIKSFSANTRIVETTTVTEADLTKL